MIGRRPRRHLDIWPGFVDALATLLMVIIFVLMVFVLAQFFMGQALSGREQAVNQLTAKVAELGKLLDLERESGETMRQKIENLSAELQASQQARDLMTAKLAEAESAGSSQLEDERKVSSAAKAQVDLLNSQIAELRAEFARLNQALEASEIKNKDQEVQISALGQRLNQALATKVEELSKYRSEFFGRLRQVLGNKPGIRIEGDRFVFQSELLFATGSADLGPEGQQQLTQLAGTLKEIGGQIPKDIPWILRVDGHTDKKPIATARFASNWELSSARAISVVKFLNSQGIAADHLAATGFGEFQPLDPADNEPARARNRRIEMRLDHR